MKGTKYKSLRGETQSSHAAHTYNKEPAHKSTDSKSGKPIPPPLPTPVSQPNRLK